MFPEQLQTLKQKQRKLWDNGFNLFIQVSRCKSGLCKNVSDEESKQRTEAMNKIFQEIGNLEIAIQVLRDSFYEGKDDN